MGRTELRKQKRANRIEERKGKVILSKKEIKDISHDASNKASKYSVEALMTCFALAEHKLYGFGSKRILRTLQCVDYLIDQTMSSDVTIEDYKKALESETGVVIKCQEN